MSSARRERMVVLWRLLLVLRGLPREWSPGCPCVLGRLLRIFCAVLSVLQRFICAQLMPMGICLALHPFILLGRAILSTLSGATVEDAYCHDG